MPHTNPSKQDPFIPLHEVLQWLKRNNLPPTGENFNIYATFRAAQITDGLNPAPLSMQEYRNFVQNYTEDLLNSFKKQYKDFTQYIGMRVLNHFPAGTQVNEDLVRDALMKQVINSSNINAFGKVFGYDITTPQRDHSIEFLYRAMATSSVSDPQKTMLNDIACEAVQLWLERQPKTPDRSGQKHPSMPVLPALRGLEGIKPQCGRANGTLYAAENLIQPRNIGRV